MTRGNRTNCRDDFHLLHSCRLAATRVFNNNHHHEGDETLKKTITAIAAVAILATGAFATPALAKSKKAAAPAAPAMHPLPAIGVLPAMLILGTKKNENFKPTRPYGKKTITSVG